MSGSGSDSDSGSSIAGEGAQGSGQPAVVKLFRCAFCPAASDTTPWFHKLRVVTGQGETREVTGQD
eukprot:10402593-Lingulodinium_polyedra.AAC.1